jgi:hypothetical protein
MHSGHNARNYHPHAPAPPVRSYGASDHAYTAETTRYFLLNLDHAQVALGLVVVIWNAQIIHETQHFVTFVAQTPQQVVCSVLCLIRPRGWYQSFNL